MPSGRSGGSRSGSARGSSSGRSSSSRSSSSGRGSFSSSSSRSSSGHFGPRRRGGTFIFFGGRRYSRRQGSAMGIMGVFAIISLFVAVIGLFMMIGANSNIKELETDYAVYTIMAKDGADGYYPQRKAESLTAMRNNKGGKWYIEYTVRTTDGSGLLYGTSFPIYTKDEALNIERSLVVTSLPDYMIVIQTSVSDVVITQDTDSVPLDHKDAKIEDDGDYIDAKNLKSTGSAMLYIGGGLFVLLLLAEIGVFSILKKSGQNTEMNANTSTTSPTQNTQNTQTQTSGSTNCAYCGARIAAGETKCPGCGAKR